MKIGDVSRPRRFADPARLRWYAYHRAVRFARRMQSGRTQTWSACPWCEPLCPWVEVPVLHAHPHFARILKNPANIFPLPRLTLYSPWGSVFSARIARSTTNKRIAW